VIARRMPRDGFAVAVNGRPGDDQVAALGRAIRDDGGAAEGFCADVTDPGLYSARCEQGGGATWLQVTSLAGTSRTRPVVNDDHLNGLAGADTGPAYGYHGYEYALTLGNLLHDVAGEEAQWSRATDARGRPHHGTAAHTIARRGLAFGSHL
jgi:hypothetical protein